MNKAVDENCNSELKMRNKDSFKRNKFVIFTKPNISTSSIHGVNAGHIFKIKESSKIIKIDAVPDKYMKKVKIEYSSDKSLLDKLFELKNVMKIKKKTFI